MPNWIASRARPRRIVLSLRRRSKRLRRWMQGVVAKGLVGLLLLLPFGVSRRLLPALSRWLAYPLLRRLIDRHLDLAYGGALAPAERRRIGVQVCHNVGLFVAELLALLRGRLPAGYLQCEAALDEMTRSAGEGRGFIPVTAHLGNWEAMGSAMTRQLGSRVGGFVARRHVNPHLERVVAWMRGKLAMPVIYQDESPLRVVRLLRRGQCVAIVPDQDVPSIAGTFLPFFGHDAYTPTGPATLAYLANVPLIPAFARRIENGLTLDVHPPIWPDIGAPKEAEVERLTRAWSLAVEAQIRRQPSDWMWFHERWRTTPERLERRRRRRQAG